jgi:L-arabinose isomerase
MPYVTVHTDDIDLSDFSSEDLIEELRARDEYTEDDVDAIKDEIHKLYMLWLDDKGDRDNRFEKALREFFANQLGKVSV